MTIQEFTSKHCRSFQVSDSDEFIQDDELFLFDLNRLINDEIDRMMPSDVDIYKVPSSLRYGYTDRKYDGFVCGAKWLKSKLIK